VTIDIIKLTPNMQSLQNNKSDIALDSIVGMHAALRDAIKNSMISGEVIQSNGGLVEVKTNLGDLRLKLSHNLGSGDKITIQPLSENNFLLNIKTTNNETHNIKLTLTYGHSPQKPFAITSTETTNTSLSPQKSELPKYIHATLKEINHQKLQSLVERLDNKIAKIPEQITLGSKATFKLIEVVVPKPSLELTVKSRSEPASRADTTIKTELGEHQKEEKIAAKQQLNHQRILDKPLRDGYIKAVVTDSNFPVLANKRPLSPNITIDSDIGKFRVNMESFTLPKNTSLILELTSLSQDDSTETKESALYKITKHWQSLTKNLDDNAKLVDMPAPNKKMLAKVINFTKAISSGNINKLLENLMNNTPATKDEQIELIKNDMLFFKEIISSKESASNWQTFFIPVNIDGSHRQLRLFIKNNQETQLDEEKNIRFIVELFTELTGNMQIDGLVTMGGR
jgi:hypothetical protein